MTQEEYNNIYTSFNIVINSIDGVLVALENRSLIQSEQYKELHDMYKSLLKEQCKFGLNRTFVLNKSIGY